MAELLLLLWSNLLDEVEAILKNVCKTAPMAYFVIICVKFVRSRDKPCFTALAPWYINGSGSSRLLARGHFLDSCLTWLRDKSLQESRAMPKGP